MSDLRLGFLSIPWTEPPPEPDEAIGARGLVKSYGDVRALDGVDLSVPRGSVLGLLGPNGAGKTTVVRILSTLLQPDGGHAHVLGVDVARRPALVRPVIGLAGQHAAVDEDLTGRENLRLVARLTHLPSESRHRRADELLERFSLTEDADRAAGTYSGGMRRRLDLAAALVHRPPVLLLDEPTTGLDPQSRRDLWSTIAELVAEGTTLLLTTQYLEEADHLADRIVVVDHGSIVAEGTPAGLKHRLGRTTVDVGVAGPHLNAAWAALSSIGPLEPMDDRTGMSVVVADGHRAALRSLQALDALGIPVESMVVREPTLDDIFLQLTGARSHRAEEHR